MKALEYRSVPVFEGFFAGEIYCFRKAWLSCFLPTKVIKYD